MENEQALLERAQRNEEAALIEIYDHFSPAIFRYAMRLLGDIYLAEECVSETFARFLQAIEKHQGPRQYLQAYLFRIAHNWITDIFRQRAPIEAELDPEIEADPDSNPSEAAHKNMALEEIRSALKSLTPEQRQVIVLKYLEGWENEQIAKAMNRPIGAVKALQHRALQALKKTLQDEVEPL